MLAKHNIKSIAIPPRKIYSYLPPVKDDLELRTLGVYGIHVSVAKCTLDRAVDPSTSE